MKFFSFLLITITLIVVPIITNSQQNIKDNSNNIDTNSLLDKLKKLGDNDASVVEIIKETNGITSKMRETSEKYIFKKIKESNEFIAGVKNHASSKKFFFFNRSDEKKYEIILSGIEDITDFYSNIGTKDIKNEIKREMHTHIGAIVEYSRKIDEKINHENNIRASLDEEGKKLEDKYFGDELALRKKGLMKRIEFADRRILMYKNFKENYSKMQPKIQQFNDNIERFFIIVDVTIGVYKDALETLKLERDLASAYNSLDDFKSLDVLTKEVEASWDDLSSIVQVLTDSVINFKVPDEKTNAL